VCFFDCARPSGSYLCIFRIGNALKFSALAQFSRKQRADRRARNIFQVELYGVDFVHDALLQSRILEHLPVKNAFIIANALE
jgi:hypothetical protein